MIWLFRLAWNGFSDAEHSIDYYANIRRDFDTWRNNPKTTPVIQRLASEVFPDLSLDSIIATMSLAELEQHDVFSEVDEQIVELLYEALDNADVSDEDVQRIIATRRYDLWFTRFANDYDIIASASALRAMLRQCQPIVEFLTSPQSGFEAYTNSLYQVDGCYRRFIAAWKTGSPRGIGGLRTVWNGSTPGTSPSLASHGSGRSARWTVGRLRVCLPKPISIRAM